MKNMLRPMLALALAIVCGVTAQAGSIAGFGNDSYASQVGYDSFNYSVRKRMESARLGNFARGFATAPILASDEALAMAPSSRTASYASARRRQLDCVYYNGFTVWGDMYQTWARQRTKDGSDGFRYRTTGPAVGFDWSSGGFTLGAATTYGWGKMKSRDLSHDRKVRTWGLSAYGQYDTDLFYINATLGYGHNSFKSSRDAAVTYGNNHDKYSANSWNIDGEFGFKFNWSGLKITPNVGIRYFNDRRGSIHESGSNYVIHANTRNYNVFELPVGVHLAYEINAGGAVIVPRVHAAWVPELSRKRGSWEGTYTVNGVTVPYSENAARRNRHGFRVGGGIEAKITKSISAHIDYACNFRSKSYQHHWNLGLGFTF